MAEITPARHILLRLAAASAASAGLLLHLLNLGFAAWVWAAGAAGPLGVDVRLVAPGMLRILAWGVGFGVLALVIVWKVGHRYEALAAALFLGVYSLWGGFLEGTPFRGTAWLPPVLIACDALAHAAGVRFTQLFPRPLEPADLTAVGPRWFRRIVATPLAALLDPRIYWPAAAGFEVLWRLLPGEIGPGGIHVLVWVSLASVYLYAGYRRGTPEERRRIFWILEGVLVFLLAQIAWVALWSLHVAGIMALDLRVWFSWLNAISAWATLACFSLAVFYAGAFDSGLVLRRTAAASLTSAGAVVIFLTLETTAEELLVEVLGFESRLGGTVGGVAAALLVRPLWVRIDRYLGGISS